MLDHQTHDLDDDLPADPSLLEELALTGYRPFEEHDDPRPRTSTDRGNGQVSAELRRAGATWDVDGRHGAPQGRGELPRGRDPGTAGSARALRRWETPQAQHPILLCSAGRRPMLRAHPLVRASGALSRRRTAVTDRGELPGSGAARRCCTSALLQPTETHTQVSDDVPTHTRPGLARGRPRQLGSRVLGTDSHLCAGRVPLFTTRTQAGSSASTVVGVTPPRVDRAGRPPHPEDAFPPRPWW